jgi:2-dehydro-3-deoxygalactonokinase
VIALIGLDWGSTHVRAYAFDARGEIVDRAQSDAGALTLTSAQQFDHALDALAGNWARQNPEAPLIACGMVGAKSGWREAGYVAIGAEVTVGDEAQGAALAAKVVQVETSLGRPLTIIPGIKSDEPDVMRGEETQLVGSGVADGIVVLPGTHSKWVQMKAGLVESFATFYTGEMNALIRGHSSVGALIKTAPDHNDVAAFEAGLHYARAGAASWLHDLFVLRASVVTGQRSEAFASTALAGWLLGCEISAALSMYPETRSVFLVASDALVPWYEQAARAFGVASHALNAEQVTARGLWLVAQCLQRSQSL